MEKREVYLKLKELAERDLVVDTYVKLAEREVQAEMVDNGYNKYVNHQPSIEHGIMNDKFYKMVYDIVSMQTQRVQVLENEIATLKAMSKNN